MKNRIPECFVLAFAIVLVGVIMSSTANKFIDKDRIVHVRGLSEKEVPANKVFWTLSYRVLGNDVQEIYKDLESKDSLIQKFLLDNGFLAEEITIGTPSFSNLDLDEYRENKSGFRFSAQSSMTVVSNKVEKVRPLQRDISQLTKQNVMFTNNYADYKFSGLNKIKPQMIEEATRNAREVAIKFAEDSHSKLGKISNAHQGLFSIDDRDENTPQIKKIRVVTTIDYTLDD